MKKHLLSSLGLAITLAFSMPVPGISSASAAAMTAGATTTTAKASPMKVAAKKTCKVTKTHKCPVKHKKHTAKKAAAKNAY